MLNEPMSDQIAMSRALLAEAILKELVIRPI
jgi:hypothetical protein